MISPQAIINPKAKIAPNVTIGPGANVGPDVEIGEGTFIGAYSSIQGNTKIGRNNKIHQYISLGEPPQHISDKGDNTQLIIGDNNTIREYCSFHRGTVQGGGLTAIGDNNYFMAYSHVGHDCIIGNNSIFANNASLAGHVTVEDHVIISAFSGVHQFCRIGAYSFLGAGSLVNQDVLPYILTQGYPASARGLNFVGIRRHGVKAAALRILKQAYKILYQQRLPLQEVINQLKPLAEESAEVKRMLENIEQSKRGIIRKAGRMTAEVV